MNLNLTKNQQLILAIFFMKPEKEYYLHELGKIINKRPGIFQRDINKLAESGLLISFYSGSRRFFKLNKNYPLYKEFKSIFFKTTGIEGSLKNALSKIKGIKRAFIYGSYATGKEKASSDVDVFVVGEVDEDKLIDSISELENKFSREVNYVLMTEKEFKKKEQNNSFVKNVLAQKTIKLL